MVKAIDRRLGDNERVPLLQTSGQCQVRMDDPELDRIRQKRMQELMGEGGSGQGMPMSQEQQQQQHEKQQEAEERRQTMLASVLQPAARERLARIALVKPDKARGIESMVLQMAQRGQLTEKLSEERLVGLLEQISEKNSTRTKVTIQRRRLAFDDEF